jgi:hypothetical protein
MLDLRLPVGIFFLIIGAILTISGLVHPVMSAGPAVNLNLDWGIILLIFGALMAGFGAAAQRRGQTSGGADPAPDQKIDMTK